MLSTRARWTAVAGLVALLAAMLVVVAVPSLRFTATHVIYGSAGREPGAVVTREAAGALSSTGAPTTDDDGGAGVFPAGVGGDGRFFVDAAGQPWFGRGDAAWSLMVEPTLDEALVYLDDRAAKGFTLVLVNVVEHYYATSPPANAAGDRPFTGADFQSSPNEPYWQHVDAVVEAAEQRGITLLLVPAYLGYEGSEDGFDTEILAASVDDLAAYGRFLADRYGSRPNIMWLIGHDKRPSDEEKDRQEALAAQLPAGQLVGIGSAPETLGSQDWSPTSIEVDFETVYTYSDDPVWSADAWTLDPPRPFIFLEGQYEQSSAAGFGDATLRRQQWGPFMAGASGVIFGNNPIWSFEAKPMHDYQGSWQDNLDSAGSADAATFGAFAVGLPWWTLQPDTTGAFLVDGVGQGTDTATARFSEALALAYVPNQRTVTLDLGVLDAPRVTVDLLDPTCGDTQRVGDWPTNQAVQVDTRSPNSAGDDDWVIIVRPT